MEDNKDNKNSGYSNLLWNCKCHIAFAEISETFVASCHKFQATCNLVIQSLINTFPRNYALYFVFLKDKEMG